MTYLCIVFNKERNKRQSKGRSLVGATYSYSHRKDSDLPLLFQNFSEKKIKVELKKMRLTKENIKKMLPGQILTVVCHGSAELDSAIQTAHQARKELGLTDEELPISRSGKTETVIIRRMEKHL